MGTALSYGWNGFKNNLGSIAVIALAVLVANLVVNLLSRMVNDSFFFSVLMSGISIFVSLVIGLGLIRAALEIVDGRRPDLGALLSTDGVGTYLIASVLVSIVVFVGFLLCIIPGFIAGFLLQFFGYAIVDGRQGGTAPAVIESDPVGSMRTSFEITSKNVGSLILLAIVCFAINLLGAFLCGIGLIVTLPVTAIAIAYAWRFFTSGRIAPQPA
ncbi:MAG TPA: hypothetical protein VF143_10705 [Candidatus Nanopelagicales bacterium]